VISQRVIGRNGKYHYYERTAGQYLVEQQMWAARAVRSAAPGTSDAVARKAGQKRFEDRFPRASKFDKVALAQWLSCWEGRPHVVAAGKQTNFTHWRKLIEESGTMPDEAFFKEAVAKGILFNSIYRETKAMNLPGYRGQITYYVMACLGRWFGNVMRFDVIWERQGISPELTDIVRAVASRLDNVVRTHGEQRNLGQEYKRLKTWEAVLDALMVPVGTNVPEFQKACADQQRVEIDAEAA